MRDVSELVALALRTSTGNSGDIDIRHLRGALSLGLNVTTQAGTTPTLDVVVKAKDEVAGIYTTVLSFTQVGAATGHERKLLANLPERIIRVEWTLAGAGAQYTFGVNCAAEGLD
jgi:hypothetical protein